MTDDEAVEMVSYREARRSPLAYSVYTASFASSLSIREIWKAIANGKLRSYKKGRRRLIFREDLEAYLRSEEE